MKQNFIIQFVQLLKNLLFDMWLGIVVEKDWAHSVDQWQLQFSVHPINLLSIHLRCNSFAGIQKAIVDLKSSSPPNSDCDFFFFFFVQPWLWEVFWSFFFSPIIELVISSCHIKFTFHCMSQFIKKWFLLLPRIKDNTSK